MSDRNREERKLEGRRNLEGKLISQHTCLHKNPFFTFNHHFPCILGLGPFYLLHKALVSPDNFEAIVWQNKFHSLVLEVDSSVAVKMVNEGFPINFHPLNALVSCIRKFMLIERSQVADFLASHAHS